MPAKGKNSGSAKASRVRLAKSRSAKDSTSKQAAKKVELEEDLSDHESGKSEDPLTKFVLVPTECVEGTSVLTDVLKDLHTDPYNEDTSELQFLYSKPSCFLILGKPGVGKTTLARRFAAEWKCHIINSTDVILENMEQQTELGLKSIDILTRGEAVPDEMVLQMIQDKMDSPAIAHHGYVLDDFPCLSEDLMSIVDQLELIKSWRLKPDFVINLRIPEKDIERRRLNQLTDPVTGIIYTKEVYDPDPPAPPPKLEKGNLTEGEEEVTAAEEEEHIEEDNLEEEEHAKMLPDSVVQRLVKRPEDMSPQVEENLAKFRENMLRVLEDYMGDHHQQFLLELDGNLSDGVLYEQLIQKLHTTEFRPAAVVTPLADPEEDDWPEEMETDDLMRALAPKQMVAPRYKWRRSRWLRTCPVALYEGNVVQGKPEFSVSFLDKMYCLSSAEAFQKFMRNPRPYLVPKMPRAPCKISVVGQPFSGKTTLCHLLAHHYGAKVFNVKNLATALQQKLKEERVEEVRISATAAAIKEVKDRIRAILEAEAAAKERERLARKSAEEALRREHEKYSQYEDEDSADTQIKSKVDNTEGQETIPSGEEEKISKSEEGKTSSPTHVKSGSHSDPKEEKEEESHAATSKSEVSEEAMQVDRKTSKTDEAEDYAEGEGPEKTAQEDEAEDKKDAEKVLSEEGPIPIPEPEVDETHPEVRAIVSVAVSLAKIAPIQLTPEFEAEVLENAIKEWEKEMRNKRLDGPLQGCWVLDNFPETPEQWNACLERNLIPDAFYFLGEELSSTDNSIIKSMCERYCLKNRDLILQEMERRVMEKDLRNQEAKLEAERQRIFMEEKQKKFEAEEQIRQKLLEEEARIAEAARQEMLGQLRVNQILWDTLAGELQTRPNFREMGFQQPRGPSFIATLTAEFHDYSELYAALDQIHQKKISSAKKDREELEDTTADTFPEDEGAGVATPVQVPSQILDEDVPGDGKDSPGERSIKSVATFVPQEKTELEILMEQPEAKAFMEKLLNFEKSMRNLLSIISETSSCVIFKIPHEDYTVETLLETVLKNEEKPYRYVAWEQTQADMDDEAEDLEAEAALESTKEETLTEEGDEAEHEPEEDPAYGIKKMLGDSSYFDPVSLKEMRILNPGNADLAAVYREKIYYFATEENREKFILEPHDYLPADAPPKVPPLRMLILGPRGSGKTTQGISFAEKLGIFHISFWEKLQEMIMPKTKKRIGSTFDIDSDISLEESDSQVDITTQKADKNISEKRRSSGRIGSSQVSVEDDEEEDSTDDGEGSFYDEDSRISLSEENEHSPTSKTSHVLVDPQSGNVSKVLSRDETMDVEASKEEGSHEMEAVEEKEEDLELTEDEEAIKAYLENNEPLPADLLESILSKWWMQEPFQSTGFILEGFPRTADEAKFLQESGLLLDAALILEVTEDDVVGRLLPPKLDWWKQKRNKRLVKKAHQKAKALAKRNAAIAKRRAVLMKEREKRLVAIKKKELEKDAKDEEEDEEEDGGGLETGEEEEEEDIEAILAEEFEEEEEENEEDEDELEEEAVSRMKNEISDIHSDDLERITVLKEALEEVMIPCLTITAGRKIHIVRYIIDKKIKPFVAFRKSKFERVYPISESLASRMLQNGYKHPSRFRRWDPVLLKEGNCMQPVDGPANPLFPCIYRSHIYFLSNQNNRQLFMQDPLAYIQQESPSPVTPIRMAIIGPPKSGKSTLAKRFEEDFGIVRLSIGEAMRYVLNVQPKSELAVQMRWNLERGRVVPDELQIQALDVALLDVRCQTKGYVLDGYPMTIGQVQLLTERSIIPVRVVEVELESQKVLARAARDRIDASRTKPLHDSSQITAIKLSCYQKMVPEVRRWYQTQHQNYHVVPGGQSKWWLQEAVKGIALSSVRRIQDYIQRTCQGRAACIYGLCIRPHEFLSRLGEFGQYCPVSLAERDELMDCSGYETLEYAAEYQGHYYRLAGPEELELFLKNPEKYLPPLAPRELPAMEDLPRRIKLDEIEGREAEILGYCPVTYLDGNLRYEALVPGSPMFAVEYKGKIYFMENEEKLKKFMRQPEKYANLTLPHKLPPAPEDMPLQNLPMLGFMEQTCAVAMIKALTAAGNVKPKYPFISSTRSSLIYIAYHLKAFNPKSSAYIRKKYKQKLQQFQETCELIKYLGNNMTVRYRDPSERPKDFDNKLETFFGLRGVEPTPTWLK